MPGTEAKTRKKAAKKSARKKAPKKAAKAATKRKPRPSRRASAGRPAPGESPGDGVVDVCHSKPRDRWQIRFVEGGKLKYAYRKVRETAEQWAAGKHETLIGKFAPGALVVAAPPGEHRNDWSATLWTQAQTVLAARDAAVVAASANKGRGNAVQQIGRLALESGVLSEISKAAAAASRHIDDAGRRRRISDLESRQVALQAEIDQRALDGKLSHADHSVGRPQTRSAGDLVH